MAKKRSATGAKRALARPTKPGGRAKSVPAAPRGPSLRGLKKTSKSAAVLAYLTRHRQASSREVVNALGAEGVEVSPSLVNAVRRKEFPEQASRSQATARRVSARRGDRSLETTVLRGFSQPHD